jgi:hypothetical protein
LYQTSKLNEGKLYFIEIWERLLQRNEEKVFMDNKRFHVRRQGIKEYNRTHSYAC